MGRAPYLFTLFGISPLLIINAPERACAKTLLQTVLAKLCCRSLSAANATLSALFRSIEKWKPTLFIDEADTFFRDNVELHGMVNAGYQRDGFLLRSEAVGDTLRTASVFGLLPEVDRRDCTGAASSGCHDEPRHRR